MQLMIEGGYFGAENKFQKINKHAFNQASIQSIKHSINQTLKQSQSQGFNAYGEF